MALDVGDLPECLSQFVDRQDAKQVIFSVPGAAPIAAGSRDQPCFDKESDLPPCNISESALTQHLQKLGHRVTI
jgi:hypothetical protein